MSAAQMLQLAILAIVNIAAIVWFAGRVQAQIDVILQKLETNRQENGRKLSEAAREIEKRVDDRFDSVEKQISDLGSRVAVLESRR